MLRLPENVQEPPVRCDGPEIGSRMEVMRRSHDGYVELGRVAGLEKFRTMCLVTVKSRAGYYAVPVRAEEGALVEPVRVQKVGRGIVVPSMVPHRRVGEVYLDIRRVGGRYVLAFFGRNFTVRTHESLVVTGERDGVWIRWDRLAFNLQSGYLEVDGARCRPLGFVRPGRMIGVTERLEVVEASESGVRPVGRARVVGDYLRVPVGEGWLELHLGLLREEA